MIIEKRGCVKMIFWHSPFLLLLISVGLHSCAASYPDYSQYIYYKEAAPGCIPTPGNTGSIPYPCSFSLNIVVNAADGPV